MLPLLTRFLLLLLRAMADAAEPVLPLH